MWDPPKPGLEPVFPALAGRFSTTEPPGKPQGLFSLLDFIDVNFILLHYILLHYYNVKCYRFKILLQCISFSYFVFACWCFRSLTSFKVTSFQRHHIPGGRRCVTSSSGSQLAWEAPAPAHLITRRGCLSTNWGPQSPSPPASAGPLYATSFPVWKGMGKLRT